MNSPFTSMSGQKKKPVAYTNDSVLEALRDLGSSVGKTVTKDVAGKVAGDAFASLFGQQPKRGEIRPNEPLQFSREQTPMPRTFLRRPEINRPPMVKMEEAGLAQKIDAVRQELKALSASIKSLNQEVQKAIDEAPVDPGIYHLNFFDGLRSMIQILREQIDDSRSWLALSTNRKKQKSYWGAYKKHGTKFGLSSERTMATQAG